MSLGDFLAFLVCAFLYHVLFVGEAHYVSDKRNYDGDRYTEHCVGLYQRPETWSCVEVPLRK